MFRSALDDIADLGRERRTRLRKEFGRVDPIKGVDAEKIAAVGRMSLPLARKVLAKLGA